MVDKRVVILPCDGIGKIAGTVSREASQMIVKMKPDKTVLTCLPLLVIGDEDAVNLIRKNPCVSINGCRLACSEINVKNSGGKLVSSLFVTDFLKKNRDLKPESSRIAELDDKGKRLAELLAKSVAIEVDKILEDYNGEGG
ncbi:MAG: putative zinc-binding protein [Candidatus Lokiarchaeia archaeon]